MAASGFDLDGRGPQDWCIQPASMGSNRVMDKPNSCAVAAKRLYLDCRVHTDWFVHTARQYGLKQADEGSVLGLLVKPHLQHCLCELAELRSVVLAEGFC